MKTPTKRGGLAAVVACALLAACASPGTRVTSSSDPYRDMARSQQAWCNTFNSSCGCTIDGAPATCSLVYACVNSGNCKAAP